MEFCNAALTAHILSETRDESTSTCADNSINEYTCFKDPIHNTELAWHFDYKLQGQK